jgi:hypothetical protein
MLNPSLPVSRLVNVTVSLSPTAAQAQNLSTLLILGNSTVIDVVSRMRSYSTLTQVATDFGTNAPEYLAASLWFAQNPQPTSLLVGRWAQTASSGQLFGGTLASTVLATLQGIANGGINFTVDGVAKNLAALNFTAIVNLNGAATVINAVLTGAICTYDAVNNRFFVTSNTTGAASIVAFATAGAGTDISNTLAMRSTSSGAYQANGIVAETALVASTLFDTNFGQLWYALTVLGASDADHQAVAGFIEATTTYHFYGVSTQSAGVLSAVSTTDIAYLLSQLKYNRTAVQYSSSSPYSVVSMLARILTVDYAGSNTALTLFYKQEPSVTAETLTNTQITALEAKNCNVLVSYNNNTSIIEPGVCVSGNYVDTVIGSAAFAVAIQTAVFNLLYLSPNKIPQTDSGTHIIVTTIEQVCTQFVNDGLLAAGTWTSAGFGSLNQNDFLPKGYYVFAPPVARQSVSDRAKRISVPIQIAAKLAGAVHSVNLSVIVNA